MPVYISEEVVQPDLVFRYLEHWSNTPDLAISTVTRIDVVALKDEMDYFGKYLLYYDSIVLTWQNETSSFFGNWWRKFQTELTFYHEVGHYFHHHSEGGQVKEQEKEADDNKRLMFRNAHPVFVPVARVVFAPLFWMMKTRNRKIRQRGTSEA